MGSGRAPWLGISTELSLVEGEEKCQSGLQTIQKTRDAINIQTFKQLASSWIM